MIIDYDWAKHVKQEDAPEYYEMYIMTQTADTGEAGDIHDIAEVGTDTLDAIEITQKLVKGINVEDFDEGWTNMAARVAARRVYINGYRGGTVKSQYYHIAKNLAVKKGLMTKGISSYRAAGILKNMGYGSTQEAAVVKFANLAMKPTLIGLVGTASIIGLSGEIWNLTRWNQMSSAQKSLGVVGTGAVVAGGIAGIAGAIGATNAWNPVGWVALGIGAAAGITSMLVK